MGKHETGYPRSPRDFYPTPSWVVDCLAQHVPVKGQTVWEPACGDGRMARALKAHGAKVIASDIVSSGRGRARIDFLDGTYVPCDVIVTNPPFGPRGKLATAFIETGLDHFRRSDKIKLMCLLLPCDFDSAITRRNLFGDCAYFGGKIVLRKRITWFTRSDGVREAPKENHSWFLWSNPPRSVADWPALLYAP